MNLFMSSNMFHFPLVSPRKLKRKKKTLAYKG